MTTPPIHLRDSGSECLYGCQDPALCPFAHLGCVHCLRARLSARVDEQLAAVRDEVIRAIEKHPPMHSPHEGHSVIREELQELWAHVRADTGRSAGARHEAIQVAAMGVRYLMDLVPFDPMPDIDVL